MTSSLNLKPIISKILLLFVLAAGLSSCSSKKNLAAVGSTDTNPYKEYKPSEVNFSNKKLEQFTKSWYGTPYKFGGMDKKGTDCSGFTHLLLKEVYGLEAPRNTRDLADQAKAISTKKLKEGDLVFFNIAGKKTSHVGVYIQNDKFVHASTKAGVTISSLQNPYYKKHFAKAARLKP
ncbi:MAG: C40 family peptidase [Luteibaculaceae bacterium]